MLTKKDKQALAPIFEELKEKELEFGNFFSKDINDSFPINLSLTIREIRKIYTTFGLKSKAK